MENKSGDIYIFNKLTALLKQIYYTYLIDW